MTDRSQTYRESRERPEQVRRLTFEHAVLASHAADWECVVPLAKYRPGDRQVRIEATRGEGILTPWRVTVLDDLPADVESVVGYGRVQSTRRQPHIKELWVNEVDEVTLANLPNLRMLVFGTGPEKRKLDAAALPTTLRDLSCNAYRSIESVEPLARLHGLERLALDSAFDTTLKPLAELGNLRWLITMPGKDLRNLGGLENLELVHLYMESARLSNLRAFRRWTKLEELNVAERGLRSIEGIQAFESLERLSLSRTGVSELAPLVGHPRLKELRLRLPDRVEDWPPLNLPALRVVEIDNYDDPLRTLGFLRGCDALETVRVVAGGIQDRDPSLIAQLPDVARRSFDWDAPGPPTREPLTPFALPDGTWTIFEDLSGFLDVGSNHDAERLIRSAVRRVEPELARRLEYDSEGSAFGVAGNEADVRRVAEIIAGLRTQAT